jgi:glutamyl endopeptidase
MATRLRLFILSLCTVLVLFTNCLASEVSASSVNAGGSAPSPPLSGASVPIEDEAGSAAPRIVRVEPTRIIGKDDRQRVTDTRFLPYSAIVKISAYDASNVEWICTGFLYAPNAVVTAGHCIYNHDPNKGTLGWRRVVAVTPGLNGNATPFPTCYARSLYSVTNWTDYGNNNSDYGAIRLDCSVGYQTGVLTIEAARSQDVEDYSTKYMIGYSGDKGGATQWIRSGIITGWNVFRIKYNIDTVGGDSGAPVYCVGGDCPNICVLAINS